MTSDPLGYRSDAEKRLITYMMLARFHDERAAKPKHAELRLTGDGWEVWGGPVEEPLPVHVDYAYEISGFDQAVLDKTRTLCGYLRVKAKRRGSAGREAQETLNDLRAGLARARAMKRAAVTDQGP